MDCPEGLLAYFDETADELHRYVSRLTGGDRPLTEDIIQDALVALVRHGRSGAEVEPGWIMRTARNRFIDIARSRQREARRIDRYAIDEVFEEPSPELGSVSADEARAMLAALPEQERWALALHTVDGLSIVEVADALGRSMEATMSLLARARRRLRKVVEARR